MDTGQTLLNVLKSNNKGQSTLSFTYKEGVNVSCNVIELTVGDVTYSYSLSPHVYDQSVDLVLNAIIHLFKQANDDQPQHPGAYHRDSWINYISKDRE